MTTPISFTKMSGSGNDFIVLDNRAPFLAEDEIAAFTRAACRRGLGLGADGVILVEETARADVDFRWRYVNADGSVGEMCGNGAMCGARFAVRHGIAPAACRFETGAGDVEATVDEGSPRVTIRLADPGLPRDPVSIVAEGRVDCFHRVMVGVPHAVARVNDADAFLDPAGFARWGRAARLHPAFAPAGTNVNAIHVIDGRTLRMRTYERGVEAETLACGTGAVASAIVGVAEGWVDLPVSVVVSSGRTLGVEFDWTDTGIANVRLTGEASFVATGVLDPEALA